MLTPQEVASHAFAKATLGGYNMAMVDEFLDQLTDDYTALYNDNAILKNKLKVLSDTVEEYRATDNAMRKTLLAAQQMADSIVNEAKQRRNQLVQDAEADAETRIAQLKQEVAAEEYRLEQARQATAAYVQKLTALHQQEVDFLARLGELAPPQAAQAPDFTADIQSSVSALIHEEEPAQPEQETQQPVEEPTLVRSAAPQGDPLPDLDPDTTRRFEDLQFGKDYEIN